MDCVDNLFQTVIIPFSRLLYLLRVNVCVKSMARRVRVILLRGAMRERHSPFALKTITSKDFIEFFRKLLTEDPVDDGVNTAVEP